ncbi:acyl-CoA dehydrogenase [Alcaligenes ammonioxydans]|uniref:Acyl-CoA dehydrogenase n=1 Tax=Alcaligenes ammonioxydans TaxID=2582914 RepID=A0ABX8SU52_9BURK|nr:acyl-CoA dehydrogenase [Alcaligenes ammonioxydans]MCH1878081.1 acyl-CoA dehydrogenase [Alcaligenes ammonioxydans]QBH18368.1 acyl-CoA dehydrogenase [Alcaligenes faecalis]QXX79522.1 acyl-CoA dehydrogenase [Alcaligenes ammonioxydans]HRK86628.1 acyl-CoA dehydrogenase [Alcaligenes faecalis]
MTYRVPTQDIRFALTELADLPGVLELPGFEDFSAELIDAIIDENARFVEQEVAPLNRAGDQNGAKWNDGVVTTTPGFKKAFEEFAKAGWQGLQHEAELGGQGLPKLIGAVACENINAANLAFSLCPLLTDGVIEAVSMVGSDEQKTRFLPALLEGRWTGTMNLTEPQAGSDLAQVASRAVPQDDGSYRISGQKIFITYGEHDMAENIIHLVLARTPDAPAGVKGISLFIVPKFLVNEDGSLGARNDVWCASLEHKLGIHGSPTAVLLYGSGKGEVGEGAVGYLVGKENEGLKYMFIMMNAARYAVGVQGIAVAERALQQAIGYANDRVQGAPLSGGKAVSIAHHPDVQRMLMQMRALTEGSRALAYFAAGVNDKARHSADENARKRYQALYEFLVPVVKGFSTEMSLEVTSLGVQVHGGMGFIEETGAAQHYRDSRILPIYEGTTAIQANDFIGRKVLRDAGAVIQGLAPELGATVAKLRERAAQDGEHKAALTLIADRLEAGVKSVEQAATFTLMNAQKDLAAVFLGSVPFLMLSGYVLTGWQMARAALAAEKALSEGNQDPFLRRKLSTSVFFASHLLPRATALAHSVADGAQLTPYLSPELL